MKKILGLDLGTNSIGWALTAQNFEQKQGQIIGVGSRIIPMSQDILGNFDAGQSHSQTAERTGYRSTRKLFQRNVLRRERLHRVLNILNFLPEHYVSAIDFEKHFGQFKNHTEVKLNYRKNEHGTHEFVFMDSFHEMIADFESHNKITKIPLDWTIYYLRKKALTQKITKEELSWILLNFNQKRGYYQLRGEEDTEDDKTKEFVSLKVKTVIDSGEEVKGNKLYDVIFENDWAYDRQTTKPSDWENKIKEFIVTTTILKNGEIKRTFKAVDSEKDWIAIKTKTQQDIDASNKTIGTYIYDTLRDNPIQKIRGKLIKTIERKYYKKELLTILQEQVKHHPELNDKKRYTACVEELYPRNEAHQQNIKGKDFSYLFLDDIIFYQRPLKSKKSTISNCAYEVRKYKKKVTLNGIEKEIVVHEPLKSISKSNPLFEEFRLWQFLRNLKIYKKENVDIDVTLQFFASEDDWIELYNFLSQKKEVEQKHIIQFLVSKKLIDKKEKDVFRWNYVEDKKYPAMPTKAQFISRLKKVVNSKDVSTFLSYETQYHLWHIIYSVKDKNEYEQALKKFANTYNLDEASFVENFAKFPPFKNEYGAYSEKAIKKLLPLMQIGKYWNEIKISNDTKKRIASIIERLETIDFDKEKIENIKDDDIPKQVLKSFLNFKNQNPLKGLNTYQACYAVYNRHSEASIITQWKTPNAIDKFLNDFKQHSLRNPIVEQVVTETLRVVKDIWNYYGSGNESFFDEIHVELGREMKNDKKKRERISKQNIENENTNQRIRNLLQELKNNGINDIKPYSPSQQEILKIYEEGVAQNPNVLYTKLSEQDVLKIRRNSSPTKNEISKYKLWLEQGYISPYTGKMIPLSKLFTTDYQIEHIIPQSRYFDNSMSNKVICESEVNQLKDNQTAFEFIKKHGTEKVDIGQGKHVSILSKENFETHCEKYFKSNRTKLKNLLSEEIPEGFINRQLNDSRYISKLIKGLLSNVVREDDEKEATSKHLLPVTGAITSKLKHDWGLYDKWNEIIAPRFQRMNDLTNSQDYGFWDDTINAYRIQVPEEIIKGFNKKRIDHRHHALDALVVACTHRKHIQYLNSLANENKKHELRKGLLIKNEQGNYTKHFISPWTTFTIDTKNTLEQTIVSFKQNVRVINKTNNKTWQWVLKEGNYKKELVKQTKGSNWAIRKPMHKESVYGEVKHIEVPKNKIATAIRTPLSAITKRKHIEAITDESIQKILENHLKNYTEENGKERFDLAFDANGIEELNKNIIVLNNGKNHHPIYKVRLYEIGSRFQISEDAKSPKSKKFVEAAKGTNLFFAMYWNKDKQKRVYETVPLNEVIEHQKQVANLPKEQRTLVPVNTKKGAFLFSLSPNDLVYVPTDEELENSSMINFSLLSKAQVNRIYKMVSSTGSECHFIKNQISSLIKKYDAKSKIGEFGSTNKSEKDIEGQMIKERCWKLQVDRLGNVTHILKNNP
ncbi:CRISPR-associated endonuclease Cas9 [Kordia antarctica]|uniref:CRISPR-associated endonuclease Cas9 n=1 Tax=Kordia antarctica TaxID=1218801 RepID=A0A7L4ZLL5_9FLAO|nr:type II CRISPR RNA-guided endonuclease Cas9 [Kordia antarctica]QHI37076.1 CRISPR-associated endonuclease Cas9 [Kordia antarctica]